MKLLNLFSKKSVSLTFSLICGLAYFIMVTGFAITYTETKTAAMLLSFFFFPTITCGMAVIVFKAMRTFVENEASGSVAMLFYTHLFVILLAVVTFLGFFI